MSKLRFGVTQTALVFLAVMIGLPVIGAAVALLLGGALHHAEQPPGFTAIQTRAQTPPEPRLQVEGLADRRVMLGPERLASTWGWTDKARGRAHIPVEAAMQRLAQQGWPTPEAGP